MKNPRASSNTCEARTTTSPRCRDSMWIPIPNLPSQRFLTLRKPLVHYFRTLVLAKVRRVTPGSRNPNQKFAGGFSHGGAPTTKCGMAAFHEELYYTINGISLLIPSPRNRPEDIPALVDLFLKKYAAIFSRSVPGLESSTMDSLVRYTWPGNVRPSIVGLPANRQCQQGRP